MTTRELLESYNEQDIILGILTGDLSEIERYCRSIDYKGVQNPFYIKIKGRIIYLGSHVILFTDKVFQEKLEILYYS